MDRIIQDCQKKKWEEGRQKSFAKYRGLGKEWEIEEKKSAQVGISFLSSARMHSRVHSRRSEEVGRSK